LALLLAVVALSACRKEPDPIPDPPPAESGIDSQLYQALAEVSGGVGPAHFILPESNDFANIPQDPNNPLNPEKVELGKLLFHETAIGMNPLQPQLSIRTWSCATCHVAQAGFQANVRQAIGEGGSGFGVAGEARLKDADYSIDHLDVQSTRSPSVLNVAYQEVTLWNGQFGSFDKNIGTEARWIPGTPKEDNNFGYAGPEIQAIAGLKVHRQVIDQAFFQEFPDYEDRFLAAFPGYDAETLAHREYAGLAIAAYERTVLANQAPFQLWLRGQYDAMTDLQKEGALLFFGKAGCSDCHGGPALADNDFYAIGMGDLLGPEIFPVIDALTTASGRGGFTANSEDDYKFKVPQLYNLKDSPFYGHGGTFTSIQQVIQYKNNALPENPNVPAAQLAQEFVPLDLTTSEIEALVEFLTNGLYDPNLIRYTPSSVPSGNCFPNNDPQSQIDLGCM
jgi:cytochrome c peroxidase